MVMFSNYFHKYDSTNISSNPSFAIAFVACALPRCITICQEPVKVNPSYTKHFFFHLFLRFGGPWLWCCVGAPLRNEQLSSDTQPVKWETPGDDKLQSILCHSNCSTTMTRHLTKFKQLVYCIHIYHFCGYKITPTWMIKCCGSLDMMVQKWNGILAPNWNNSKLAFASKWNAGCSIGHHHCAII